ncbi:MAG: hypothetical protein QFB87_03290 [Patescibacteria group bacterium]|nr:hypothetical protein [Patescibacteria group bacterium]
MKPLHLIYVPGLGDQKIAVQAKLVATWKHHNVSYELCQMNWADGEWAPKLEKILKAIDTAVANGQDVALVGASAGGCAVVTAYAARQDVVTGVVVIAGKVNRPQTVGHGYKSKNPAFWTAINAAQPALASLGPDKRSKILSRRGLLDEVVLPSDNIIAGAVNRVTPSIGHVITIGSQLLLGASSFIKFLRKQQTAPKA